MLLLAALLACVPSAPSDTTGSPTDIDPASDDSGSNTDSGGGNDTGATDTGGGGGGGTQSFETFIAVVPGLLCGVYEECFGLAELGLDSMETCVDVIGTQLTSEFGSCADFDPVAAEACLEAITTSTCDELSSADAPTAVCETICG